MGGELFICKMYIAVIICGYTILRKKSGSEISFLEDIEDSDSIREQLNTMSGTEQILLEGDRKLFEKKQKIFCYYSQSTQVDN